MKVRGIITLKITIGSIVDSNVIEVNYLMADALSTYNVILCQPTINSLEVIISTQHMVLKYLLPNRRVGTVQRDQESAQECYQSSLKMRKEDVAHEASPFSKLKDTNISS